MGARFTRSAAPAALCLMLTGCYFLGGPDCIDETRTVILDAPLLFTETGAPAPNGRAGLDMFEARNARWKTTSEQSMLWGVRAENFNRSAVTAVHVHERGTNRMLVQLQIDTMAVMHPIWITVVNTRQPHPPLQTDWNNLYQLAGTNQLYLDVHTGSATPALRADLTNESQDWSDFRHSYCS